MVLAAGLAAGLVAGLTAGLGAIPSEDKKRAPMCLDMANNGETRSFSVPKTLAVGLSDFSFYFCLSRMGESSVVKTTNVKET